MFREEKTLTELIEDHTTLLAEVGRLSRDPSRKSKDNIAESIAKSRSSRLWKTDISKPPTWFEKQRFIDRPTLKMMDAQQKLSSTRISLVTDLANRPNLNQDLKAVLEHLLKQQKSNVTYNQDAGNGEKPEDIMEILEQSVTRWNQGSRIGFRPTQVMLERAQELLTALKNSDVVSWNRVLRSAGVEEQLRDHASVRPQRRQP